MEIPKTPETSYIVGRFKELMSEGLGSHEIRGVLRDEGLKFSNATASKIFQGIAEQNPLDIRFLTGDSLPSPEAFNQSTVKMPAQYGFLVGVTTESVETGEFRQGLHIVYFDSLDTIDNILEDVSTELEESYYQGQELIARIDIINAYTN